MMGTRKRTQEIIQILVGIGASERFDDFEKVLSQFPHLRSGHFMRLRPEPWNEVATTLDDAQLISLIKTLTVLEARLPDFRCGSVSPVIHLMHRLALRSPDLVPEIVDWILSHSDNPYLPFGE